MYRLVQRRGIIGLFCLLFVASSVVPGWAQKDNRFEVSKNLDIFNSLLKEVEMFYVDSVDVDKTVQRGIEAMLAGLDPYTEYYPEQKTEELSLMTTGEYGGIGSLIRQRNNEGGVMIAEPTEGMPADLAGLKPGDLIFYGSSRGRINHVAMYIGNGQIIHAASRRSGIKISTWNYRTPAKIVNVLGD